MDALKQSETANKSSTSLSTPSTKETKKKQMSISQSGNFNNDFRSFILDLKAPSTQVKIQAYSKSRALTAASDTRSINSVTEYESNVGPVIYALPNIVNPRFYQVRGFKIDGLTMKALLQAIHANGQENVRLNIARCRITSDAWAVLAESIDVFSSLKHLEIVPVIGANFDDDNLKLIQKLFTKDLETISLRNFGFNDEFLNDIVDSCQKNESLKALILDFNNFTTLSALEKILRINRSLVLVSVRKSFPSKEFDLSALKTQFKFSPSEQIILRKTILCPTESDPKIFSDTYSILRNNNCLTFSGNQNIKKFLF